MTQKRLFIIFFLIGLAITQHLGWLAFTGIRPNLVLVFLVILTPFLEDFIFYLVLIILSYLLLKLEPILDWPVLFLMGLLTISYPLARTLPWQRIFNQSFLIILVTVIFYFAISFKFVINNPILLIGEVLYNLVLGLILMSLVNNAI